MWWISLVFRLMRTRVYTLFAKILDYPDAEVSSGTRDLISETVGVAPDAARLLENFERELSRRSLGELQELYTSAFDMRPDSTTNLGCHLFGDDARRNIFLAQLKERMEARQIPMGCELPDHLCLVLRLLAAEDSEEEARALIEDCLDPALTRMLSCFDPAGGNPYADALRALLTVLRKEMEGVAAAPEAEDGLISAGARAGKDG